MNCISTKALVAMARADISMQNIPESEQPAVNPIHLELKRSPEKNHRKAVKPLSDASGQAVLPERSGTCAYLGLRATSSSESFASPAMCLPRRKSSNECRSLRARSDVISGDNLPCSRKSAAASFDSVSEPTISKMYPLCEVFCMKAIST